MNVIEANGDVIFVLSVSGFLFIILSLYQSPPSFSWYSCIHLLIHACVHSTHGSAAPVQCQALVGC